MGVIVDMTTTRDFTLTPALYGGVQHLRTIGSVDGIAGLSDQEIENLTQVLLEYLGGDTDDVAEFIEQCRERKANATDFGEHRGDR